MTTCEEKSRTSHVAVSLAASTTRSKRPSSCSPTPDHRIISGISKRLDEARSRRFFVLLEGLPIVRDGETGNRAFADIVHLARSYQLSAYDAAYLGLAIRRGLPLACLDGK